MQPTFDVYSLCDEVVNSDDLANSWNDWNNYYLPSSNDNLDDDYYNDNDYYGNNSTDNNETDEYTVDSPCNQNSYDYLGSLQYYQDYMPYSGYDFTEAA